MYNVLFDIYGKIPSRSSKRNDLTNFVFSLFRLITRKCMIFIMKFIKRKKSCGRNINNKIIVSLTSFPKRLDTIWMTIVSLKRQTILPKKIVLYLINEEVSKESLPDCLLNEIDDMFEIRFRDGKLRAHGKYHFAMKDFPDSCIITVDDDMIYPYDTIEALWSAHKSYPDSVITNNTHQILSDDNTVKSYSEWLNIYESKEFIDLPNLIPMGVGGALYPPHILYKDTLNIELVKKLSYLNDDLWLYAMTRLANRCVIKTVFNCLRIMPIDITDNVSLTSINNGELQNDVQFNNIRNYYLNQSGIDIAN